MADKFECEECGREFDSKRGLSIHQSQMHGDEEKNQGEDSSHTVTFSAKHAMIATFAVGLVIGFLGGTSTSTSNSLTIEPPTDNPDTPEEVFTSIAKELGADTQAFRSCYSSSSGEEWNEDKSEIESVEGRLGTPTFFIGNSEIGYEKVTGAQPLSDASKPNMLDDLEEQLSEAENAGTIEANETRLEGVELEGEPSLGSEEAPVKVIEYSDYGCPFCSEWAGVDASGRINIDRFNWFEKLKQDYINEDKVQFIYKDYPVRQLHPNAPKAHQAANCILEQDEKLYWQFHDKLFEERERWAS